MPHWNGTVDTGSPPGYPSRDAREFERTLRRNLPPGVKLLRVSWEENDGDWTAHVTLDGDAAAEQFLRNDLEASNVTRLLGAAEKRR